MKYFTTTVIELTSGFTTAVLRYGFRIPPTFALFLAVSGETLQHQFYLLLIHSFAATTNLDMSLALNQLYRV